MLEKPPIQDDQISACLRDNYGLTITSIEFLPLGLDNYAGVYRLEASDTYAYFLKVKTGPVNVSSLALPRYLNDHGMDSVVAPLPTTTGQLWCTVESFTLTLYPFINGKSGWGADLSDGLWNEYGEFLRSLHATKLPPEVLAHIPTENFKPDPHWHSIVKRLHETILHNYFAHPIENQVAAFWREKYDDIDMVLKRTTVLSRIMQDRSHKMVICHADIHTGNLLITPDERLFVVDWDQPVMAPKECDLLFVTQGGFLTNKPIVNLILRGYGDSEIDWQVMAYYRFARAVEDFGGFAERIFLMDNVSDETKQDSADWFRKQFDPGSIVHAAQQLNHIV
jgi:spectinomycin phosphotransferase